MQSSRHTAAGWTGRHLGTHTQGTHTYRAHTHAYLSTSSRVTEEAAGKLPRKVPRRARSNNGAVSMLVRCARATPYSLGLVTAENRSVAGCWFAVDTARAATDDAYLTARPWRCTTKGRCWSGQECMTPVTHDMNTARGVTPPPHIPGFEKRHSRETKCQRRSRCRTPHSRPRYP